VIHVLSSVADVIQLAHDTGFPHPEPPPVKGNTGGASAIVVIAGILVSLVAVAGLIWLKRRVDD
jgi:LPXTG-motif cell wall-anchored protein